VSSKAPALTDKFDIIRQHISAIHAFYGEVLGVRIARKHMGWYMQYIHSDAVIRKKFNALQSAGEQLHSIDHYSHICTDIYIENEVLAA
jgi:tRNA-dihydrouridine synthase B